MLQTPLFELKSEWSPPRLEDLPDWSLAKRVGLDTETKDPGIPAGLGPGVRHGGEVCGISFAIEDGQSFYLPIRHLGGDNLPAENVIEYLKDQSRRFKGILVGANLGYDLDFLAEEGIEFKSIQCMRDVQIADPLIHELYASYKLETIAERWGLPGKDETLLKEACATHGFKTKRNQDIKESIWKLPGRYVGPYGEWDAELPLKLIRKQEKVIDEEELWEIYNLESRLQPVLLKVKRRGIRVNLQKLEEIERWSQEQEALALSKVKSLTGVEVPVGDVWKAEVMARPLVKEGFKVGVDSKGKPSVDQELLGQCGEVGAQLMRARKVNKLRTTFAQSVRNHLVGDRIHCTLNQLRRSKEDGDEGGARYGRLSSEHPNMQQQPSRDEFAAMWRSIYVPDNEGQEWFCNDFSQQEPRWLTHYAEIMRFPGAREAAERYRRDPSTDNHNMMTEIVHPGIKKSDPHYKRERTACKQIFLGLCYGMGGAKLARKIGLPTRWAVFSLLNSYGSRQVPPAYFKNQYEAMEYVDENGGRVFEVAGEEAQEKLDKFNKNAPYVRSMARKCEEVAKKRGFIVTVLGRRCRFPRKPDGTYDWTHKSLNRLIQGTSADQVKKAMVDIDDAGFDNVQLQVHDELDGSINNRQEARDIAEIMRVCVPCNIPMKVDVEIGPSWGEVE